MCRYKLGVFLMNSSSFLINDRRQVALTSDNKLLRAEYIICNGVY